MLALRPVGQLFALWKITEREHDRPLTLYGAAEEDDGEATESLMLMAWAHQQQRPMSCPLA